MRFRSRSFSYRSACIAALLAGCTRTAAHELAPAREAVAPVPTGASGSSAPEAPGDKNKRAESTQSAVSTTAGRDAGADAHRLVGPGKPLHLEATDDLVELALAGSGLHPARRHERLEKYLGFVLGATKPSKTGQGNAERSVHPITRAKCLAALEGVTLQTEAQRRACGGAPNMVPVGRPGEKPKFCIDIFEYPNVECELPMVWVPPSRAKKICEMEGKRLCDQNEWDLACRGDPAGRSSRRYAYGDKLDLDICHTRRPKADTCRTRTAKSAFDTCGTDTVPSGSYPQCRSRYGVYDMHGNVAEIMTRKAKDGSVVSQLKGSAWFYEQVSKEVGEPAPSDHKDAYPDHCNFDPRWHVEPIARALHVNYHLGFRCCSYATPDEDKASAH